jgi:hypothetical protein
MLTKRTALTAMIVALGLTALAPTATPVPGKVKFHLWVRAQADTWEPRTGIGLGLKRWAEPGDFFWGCNPGGKVIKPKIPPAHAAFSLAHGPKPRWTDAEMAGCSAIHWDAEYNKNAKTPYNTPEQCYQDALMLRTWLDDYNARSGRDVLLFGHIHLELIDYGQKQTPTLLSLLDMASVGIVYWQNPAAPTFVENALPYVKLIQKETRKHQAGLLLKQYFAVKLNLTPLTSEQLAQQMLTALAPVSEGGLGVEIIDSYYGAAQHRHDGPYASNNYAILDGALARLRVPR